MSSIANTFALKERLLKRIERLPETDIQEVLDFVEFLQSKRTKRHKVEPIPEKAQFDPEKDPILKIMGIADVEPFANEIDQELYGK